MGLVVPLNSCILDELPELLGGPAGLDPIVRVTFGRKPRQAEIQLA